MKSTKKITPEKAAELLKSEGITLSVSDAAIIVGFLYLFAEVFYQQQVDEA